MACLLYSVCRRPFARHLSTQSERSKSPKLTAMKVSLLQTCVCGAGNLPGCHAFGSLPQSSRS